MNSIPIRHISAIQKEPEFSIRGIHELLAGEDMVQELHRHDFYYVLALEKGAGAHAIDFTPYTICDHTVFFMRPGQVHQLLLKAGSTGYLMQFSGAFYSCNTNAAHHYELTAEGFQKLLVVLLYIFQEYTDQQEKYQEVIKANMGIFFIELARQFNKNPSDTVNLYVQEQLEAFSALLEKHVVSHKQVPQYAELMNLSTYQLNAITKATVGKTCSALINEYIILEAKRYLLATADQVNQIADRLGYEDISYFIRFFKKHTGHSPESFRHHFR